MHFPQNYWYPILDSRSVKPNRLIKLTRFSENLVVGRKSNGEWFALKDQCPHKGAPLSLGKLVGDCVRCPYHGFEYNTEGACKKVPALGPDREIPLHLKVKSYSVRENYGFLWMWWGKKTPTNDLPFYEELKTEPIRYQTDSFDYPASFFRVMESNFDAYHIDHLHAGLMPKIGSIVHSSECDVNGDNIVVNTEYRHTPEGKSLLAVNHIIFPNLALAVCPERKFKNIIACVPIDEKRTWFMVRFYLKTFEIPLFGWLHAKMMNLLSRHFFAPQDFAIAKEQLPKETGMGSDRLIFPADKGVVEFWKRLRQDQALTSSTPSPLVSNYSNSNSRYEVYS